MKKYLGLITALCLVFVARDSQATVVTYFVPLYGSIDGSGNASLLGHGTITVDSETYSMDWSFDVPGVSTLKQASIRMGTPDAAGPMVVRLRNEMQGTGLRDADLASIVLHPESYYIMLRPKVDGTTPNARAYRGIRGQLVENCPVPEPTSVTLLGLALVAGGLRARRRKAG